MMVVRRISLKCVFLTSLLTTPHQAFAELSCSPKTIKCKNGANATFDMVVERRSLIPLCYIPESSKYKYDHFCDDRGGKAWW